MQVDGKQGAMQPCQVQRVKETGGDPSAPFDHKLACRSKEQPADSRLYGLIGPLVSPADSVVPTQVVFVEDGP